MMSEALVFGWRWLFAAALAGLLVSSCSEKQMKPNSAGTEEKSTATHMDSLVVYCDEAFKYLMDQEIVIYEKDMPGKHIHMIYEPESQVLKNLMTDSFSSVVLGRRLKEAERKELYQRTNLQAEEFPFAKDAIAVIANEGFERDTLPYELIQHLLTNASGQYKLVFEGNGSGEINYMFAQVANTSARPPAFAADNTGELISYLQKDDRSIGFIPYARFSDDDDSTERNLLKKVKVIYISRNDSIGQVVVSAACQSDIADGSYPFARPINFISHSMDERVGRGFVNFLYGSRSGRIVLKSGLIPAIMPQRVINVNTDGIK